MISDQEIQKQINDDYNAYYEKPYDGRLAIPENIIQLFINGVKSLTAWNHKINFHKVKAISSKQINQLTIGDLQDIVKIILNTRLESLYNIQNDAAFFSAIDNYIKVEKFIIEYNVMDDNFKQNMEMKRTRLKDLSGKNGMKIIRAEA